MEIPGGGGGVTRSPLEWKIQWGGGSNWKKPSVGEVWIFCGTTHYDTVTFKCLLFHV